MSEESLHGLSCPNCGGTVPIPEGQVIVKCPYCEMRSIVHGERGVLRYQVPQNVTRKSAVEAWRKFLSSSLAIARRTASQAKLTEAFLVYLPFWTIWGRVAAWAFGQEKVGSGDDARYEPRERRVVQEMTWNGAACDVGEFGVTQVPTVEHALQPFDAEALHNAGLVFEPVNSFSDARQTASERFEEQVHRKARLDRLAQLFVRPFRQRYALVYHPLWVMRYLYRGRSFQVVVDGYSGKVLFGKAPGNTLYRAAVLVIGMAIGAFLAIDVPAALFGMGGSDDGNPFLFALGAFVVGIGIMGAAYRAFRHGEEYEFRHGGSKKIPGLNIPIDFVTKVKDIEEWTSLLN